MYPFALQFSPQIFLSSEEYMSLYLFHSVPSTNAIAVARLIQTMLGTNKIFLSSEDRSSNLDYTRSQQVMSPA